MPWNGNVIALIFRALCLPRGECLNHLQSLSTSPPQLQTLHALHDWVKGVRLRGLP